MKTAFIVLGVVLVVLFLVWIVAARPEPGRKGKALALDISLIVVSMAVLTVGFMMRSVHIADKAAALETGDGPGRLELDEPEPKDDEELNGPEDIGETGAPDGQDGAESSSELNDQDGAESGNGPNGQDGAESGNEPNGQDGAESGNGLNGQGGAESGSEPDGQGEDGSGSDEPIAPEAGNGSGESGSNGRNEEPGEPGSAGAGESSEPDSTESKEPNVPAEPEGSGSDEA